VHVGIDARSDLISLKPGLALPPGDAGIVRGATVSPNSVPDCGPEYLWKVCLDLESNTPDWSNYHNVVAPLCTSSMDSPAAFWREPHVVPSNVRTKLESLRQRRPPTTSKCRESRVRQQANKGEWCEWYNPDGTLDRREYKLTDGSLSHWFRWEYDGARVRSFTESCDSEDECDAP
jgi:hypothetical protein